MPPKPHKGQLDVSHRVQDGRHTIAPEGELDLATFGPLMDLAARLCMKGAAEVVIDLRDVTFMDSTGLRTVLRIWELCNERHCEFALISDQGPCQKLFELVGVAERLPFRDPTGAPRADTHMLA